MNKAQQLSLRENNSQCDAGNYQRAPILFHPLNGEALICTNRNHNLLMKYFSSRSNKLVPLCVSEILYKPLKYDGYMWGGNTSTHCDGPVDIIIFSIHINCIYIVLVKYIICILMMCW